MATLKKTIIHILVEPEGDLVRVTATCDHKVIATGLHGPDDAVGRSQTWELVARSVARYGARLED